MLAGVFFVAATTPFAAAPLGCRADVDQVSFLQGPLTSLLDHRQPSELPASQPQSLSALEVDLKNAEKVMKEQLRDVSDLDTVRENGPRGDEGRDAVQPLEDRYNADVQPPFGLYNAAAVQPLGGLSSAALGAAFGGAGRLGLTAINPVGLASNSNGFESAQLQLQLQLQEDFRLQQNQIQHAQAAWSAYDSPPDVNVIPDFSAGLQQKAAQEKLEHVQKKVAAVEGLVERIDSERARESADAAASLEAVKSQAAGLVRELEVERAQAANSARELEVERAKEQAAEIRAQEAEVRAQKEAATSAQVTAEVQEIQENMLWTDQLLERWPKPGSPPIA